MELSISLSIEDDLSLGMSMENDLEIDLSTDDDIELSLMSDTVQVYAGGEYQGPYDVTPTLSGFGVETKDLTMTDDVTIEPIPVNSAINQQGGYTVVIG